MCDCDPDATRVRVTRQPDGSYQCEPDCFKVITDEAGAIIGMDHRQAAA